jgi:RTA1 like protein
MLAEAKAQSTVNLGNHIIVLGLIVQLLFFGFFIIVSIVFHRRITVSPTDLSLKIDAPWSRYLRVLYTASVLVMVRSVYRVVEYIQGKSGVLQEQEAYLYIFDATFMFLCCFVFHLFHPSQIIAGGKYEKMQTDLEMLNDPRHSQRYQ